MSVAASIELPPWAAVNERRRAHIVRVTALLDKWAGQMKLDDAARSAWHDAGRFHDALRNAPDEDLRALTGEDFGAAELLHGPAAAVRLAAGGETREDVLEAVRWHTIGHAEWERTGRALYMADFLEPGRKFDVKKRAACAARVPPDFDGTFRTVVRMRIEWTLREEKGLHEETARLWNAVR